MTTPHMTRLWPAALLFPLLCAAAPADDAYRAARAALLAGRHAEAAARFQEATASTNATFAAAAWFGRGEALFTLNRWSEAAEAYAKLIERYPQSPLAAKSLYARGCAEMHAGQTDQALSTFTTFQACFPTNALAASCAESVAAIRRTREADAHRAETDAQRRALEAVNTAVRDGRYAEAAAGAARYLKDHPDAAQAADLRYLAASCAYRAGDFAGAAAAFRTFLSRDPQHTQAAAAHVQLADSLMRTGATGEARPLYEALLRETQDPQLKAQATLALGDCAAADKRWEEAETQYLRVELLEGSDALRPDALKRLADLYDRSGQPEKAGRTREELARRYPNR